MKRKEIAKMLEDAGRSLDHFGSADIKSKESDESVGAITADEIKAMETTLAVCHHMLVGDYEPDTPVKLMTDLLYFHASAKLGYLSQQGEGMPSDGPHDAGGEDEGDGKEG